MVVPALAVVAAFSASQGLPVSLDPSVPARHVSVPPRPCGIVTAGATTGPHLPATAHAVGSRRSAPAAVCPPPPKGPRVSFAVVRLVRWGRRRAEPPKSQPGREVIVRVYDAVGVRAQDRIEAQATVERILRPSGFGVRWVVCGAGHVWHARCAQPPRPSELMVRFSRATPKTQGAALGFAYVPGVLGTVLVDRVQQVAGRSGVAPATLFGATLAHELTHLLIGAATHGTDGLMQAIWDDDEIRRAGGDGFALSPADRERLMALTEARATPEPREPTVRRSRAR